MIRQLNEKLKELPVIGFDSEDNTKGIPVSFCFYGDEGSYYTRSRAEAIEYVYSVPKQSIFAAHNLEYDLNNLFKSEHWLFYDTLRYASGLITANLKGRKHVFLNSSNFFHGSLAQMGKIIGLEKFEDDRQSILDPDYLTRDAQIVYEFIKKFQTQVVDELHINMGITIGQMAMKSYRSRFLPRKQIETHNSPLSLAAYYGGRVEIFYKGTMRDTVFVSDINSSYPNVMRNEKYPDTATMEQSTLDTHEHGIGTFTVHVPADTFIPVLPVKTAQGRLFFPHGTFTGTWTYPEIRYAQQCGTHIVKEHTGEGTNSSLSPFTEFIDYFYEKRLAAKEQKNGFLDLFYKLLMNNLYGKFAQHKPSTFLTRVPLTKEQEEEAGNIISASKKLGFYAYTVERFEPPTTANYVWGVYVTSYARMNLHRGLQAVHDAGGTLLYCDTDSIMYTGLTHSPLDLDPKKLGCWDVEQFDIAHFEQSKGYMLGSYAGSENGLPVYDIKKLAFKGVPVASRYDYFMSGSTKIRKPIKLRESLVLLDAKHRALFDETEKNEFSANYWREVEKAMRSVYIKRSGEPVTLPVDYADIEPLEKNLHQVHGIGLGDHLESMDISLLPGKFRQPPKFTNVDIPQDWFTRTYPIQHEIHPATDAIAHIQLNERDAVESPSTQWFSGSYISELKDEIVFELKTYHGRPVPPFMYGKLSKSLSDTVKTTLRKTKNIFVFDVKIDYINNSAEITYHILNG